MARAIEEHRLAKALPKIPKKEIPGEAPPEIRKGIESLYARGATQRAVAARDLGRMGAQAAPAIRFLIAMLHDRTDAKCDFGRTTPGDEAMKALGRIGQPALDPLIKALKDEDGNVQLRSAEALGEIGDARAVDPLIAILKTSKNENVQSRAAKTLVRIGKPASAPLRNAIPNLGQPARYHAERAVEKITRSNR